jgi:hypothetical protein
MTHADQNKKNGFTRSFTPQTLTLIATKKKDSLLNKFCGIIGNQFIFANNDPRKIVITNSNLNIIDSFDFKIPLSEKVINGYKFFVDSPFLYLFSFNQAKIYRKNLLDISDSLRVIKLDVPLYTKAALIDSSSIAIRAFDKSRHGQIFLKAKIGNGKISNQSNLYSNSEYDAGFSTDGSLLYDPSTKRLTYVQYYVNNVFNLDTNMLITKEYNTIDTFRSNNIKTKNFTRKNNTGSIIPSVPLKTINKDFYAYKGNIYVLSNLLADNEEIEKFTNNNVVDIYDTEKGVYKYSFYIPNSSKEKVQEFFISNNTLIATYNKEISIYNLTGIKK